VFDPFEYNAEKTQHNVKARCPRPDPQSDGRLPDANLKRIEAKSQKRVRANRSREGTETQKTSR
jgi:hypothetical protein